jgi:hypothetical protein
MFMFAEFERGIICEHVMAGVSPAKADGIQFGRRRLEDSDADKVAAIVAAGAKGTGIRRIARDLGVRVDRSCGWLSTPGRYGASDEWHLRFAKLDADRPEITGYHEQAQGCSGSAAKPPAVRRKLEAAILTGQPVSLPHV